MTASPMIRSGAAPIGRAHWRLILTYLNCYRWRYLLGFVAVLAASFVVMLPPVVLRRAVDSIEAGVGGTRLAYYAGIIILLAAVESVLGCAARYLVSGTSRQVEYELRSELAAQYLRLDQGFYLRSATGDLMARCTNDLNMVRTLIGPTLVEGGRALVMLLVGFAFMLSLNVRLALIALIYMPLVMALICVGQAAMERRYIAMQEQFGELANRVQENISGIRTIKAYAQEETEIATFARANQEMVRRALSCNTLTAGLWPLMGVAVGASTILVLWFGGRDVVAGRITIGQFIEFNAYLAILARPLFHSGWIFIDLQQGVGSLKRVAEVLLTAPAIVDPPRPAPGVERPRGEIAFENVTFGYRDEPVLRGLSLSVPAGTSVAIVGATGAGKTTLVALLTRLYDPRGGPGDARRDRCPQPATGDAARGGGGGAAGELPLFGQRQGEHRLRPAGPTGGGAAAGG